HVLRGRPGAIRVIPREGHGGHVLYEGPVPRLGFAEALFGLLLLRDVEVHTLPILGPTLLVTKQDRALADPDDPAVLRHHAVLGVEGLAGRELLVAEGRYPLSVV